MDNLKRGSDPAQLLTVNHKKGYLLNFMVINFYLPDYKSNLAKYLSFKILILLAMEKNYLNLNLY